MLSRVDEYEFMQKDIDDFAGNLEDRVATLKTTIAAAMRRQQSATIAMAKPAASMKKGVSNTKQSAKTKKKTSQEQQPPVEEKSEEELTLETWGQLKSKIGEILQKFPDLTNLKKLHKSIKEI